MPAASIRLSAVALLACVSAPALAGDVSVKLDAGAGFLLKDRTGLSERLRVDEATGNVSRNGALFVHTTGTDNTFVGAGAGNLGTSGTGANTAFGAAALQSDTTGDRNSAFGSWALRANTTGYHNSAFGEQALRSNTGGVRNTAVGRRALFSNGAGNHNSALGERALFSNTVGGANSAFGSVALYANTEGSWNAAVGLAALTSNTTGDDNTALGRHALAANRSGSRNVALGSYAGRYQTTGSDNVYLANRGVAGESGQIRIGTVGTHTQASIAGIHGNTAADGVAVLVDANGVLGTTPSSARFKQDVRELRDASDLLMRLRPVAFRYKPEVAPREDGVHYGLIAEEVAQVAPELVAADLDGRPYSVKYHELPALLLAQNQAQQRTIEALAARVAQLEAGRRPAPR